MKTRKALSTERIYPDNDWATSTRWSRMRGGGGRGSVDHV